MDLGVKKLIVRGDSQLVARQINKDYQSPLMESYIDEVRKLEERFDGIQAEHVPRVENDIADYLSKRAALKLLVEPGTFVLQLTHPSVQPLAGQNKQGVARPRQVLPHRAPKSRWRRCFRGCRSCRRAADSGRTSGHGRGGGRSRGRRDAFGPCHRATGSDMGVAHHPIPSKRRAS